VANLVGSFRAALAADLALRFPDAEVYQGERTGAATDRAKVAVVWAGFGEQGDQVVVGESRILVRYWPASPKVANDTDGGVRDPGELEQAAWDLATFLQTKQVSYGATGAWFCRLTTVTPDYDPAEWGVEAEVVVMFDNPAVIA
jgi:hypothetical protein